jgi:hypothetical protein
MIDFSSGAPNLVKACYPNNLSNSLEIGYETGYVNIINSFTNGKEHSAIAIYFGPIQILYGITSPKNKTAVTDRSTAYHDGTSLSRKIGRASRAIALQNKSVTRRW